MSIDWLQTLFATANVWLLLMTILSFCVALTSLVIAIIAFRNRNK